MEDKRRRIVEELARSRGIERVVCNVARAHSLNADLSDLSQMVYEVLLEYRADRIVELNESGALGFFIVRIILNQYCSKNSPFYAQIRRFGARSESIGDYGEGE